MDGSSARVLLGLRPDATRHDVKQAYRTLAKRHHPDRGGERASFEALTRANEVALRTAVSHRRSHNFLEAARLVGEAPIVHLDDRRRRVEQRTFAEELALAMTR